MIQFTIKNKKFTWESSTAMIAVQIILLPPLLLYYVVIHCGNFVLCYHSFLCHHYICIKKRFCALVLMTSWCKCTLRLQQLKRYRGFWATRRGLREMLLFINYIQNNYRLCYFISTTECNVKDCSSCSEIGVCRECDKPFAVSKDGLACSQSGFSSNILIISKSTTQYNIILLCLMYFYVCVVQLLCWLWYFS